MDPWRLSPKTSKMSLLVIIMISLAVNIAASENLGSPEQSYSYSYTFLVDDEGTAMVTINYTSNEVSGSSWVIVPKFLKISNRTPHGKMLDFGFSSTEEKLDTEFYFYRVLDFSFESDGYFELIMQFNFSRAAIIIEPDGIFLSPQIGFEPGSTGRAEVIFPSNFNAGRTVAGYGYLPSFTNSNYVCFDDLHESPLRLEIEFKVSDDQPDLFKIENGIFAFETARRYENQAQEILLSLIHI